LIRAKCTTLCDKVCQLLPAGRWFSPGPPVSSTNITDHHDITEILLKVALNTIKTNKQKSKTTDPNDLLADIAEEKVYLALNNNHSYSYTIATLCDQVYQ
jgi:hypothetical protein